MQMLLSKTGENSIQQKLGAPSDSHASTAITSASVLSLTTQRTEAVSLHSVHDSTYSSAALTVFRPGNRDKSLVRSVLLYRHASAHTGQRDWGSVSGSRGSKEASAALQPEVVKPILSKLLIVSTILFSLYGVIITIFCSPALKKNNTVLWTVSIPCLNFTNLFLYWHV